MWGALLFLACTGSVFSSTYYDSYYQYSLNTTQYQQYVSNSTDANCTILVAACNATERRRIDGTCNNLIHPASGATRTPYYRVLPADYHIVNGNDYQPRLAKSGNALPVCRKVRTDLVPQGVLPDRTITHLAAHILVFFATDITNTRDTTNYVTWRPWCCKAQGASDPMCAPNPVPIDDPVHRFSGINCLNMTKPLTFQTSGCLPNTTTPLRIVDATPTFDMSPVYGNSYEGARRQNISGLLAIETINNRTYPPTSGINLLLGINFFGIIFYWRHHNHIATKLAEVNPCWTDDQLFYTAREINIALGLQMYYYELMPLMMGECDLNQDGVTSNTYGFRNVYNESVLPQISLEYPVVLRWLHLIQDGALKFYDNQGNYLKQYPIVNLTSRIAYIKEDDNMDGITQGCFRQATGNVLDIAADPDIVNLGMGPLQQANDIMTNDLAKNRYFGFQPYINYLNYCFKVNVTSFDDLKEYITPERIEQLKRTYEDVSDIDLLAGLWSETLLEEAYVPPTFYCLIKEQMLRTIRSDRHWYESSTRPYAFTTAQLNQIRWGGTGARMLCNIGDTVTSIQEKVFMMISDDNPEKSCDEIVDLDYFAWQDTTCANAPTRPEKSNVYNVTKVRDTIC